MILPGTQLEGAVAVAERIRAQLAEQAIMAEAVGGTGLIISIGVVQYDGTPDDLIRRADAARIAPRSRGRTA